jgi:hypothetical protein
VNLLIKGKKGFVWKKHMDKSILTGRKNRTPRRSLKANDPSLKSDSQFFIIIYIHLPAFLQQ